MLSNRNPQKAIETFTIYIQEKIAMDVMHAILFEGYYRFVDVQEDDNHVYNIKFSHVLKKFEVYKMSRELNKWVMVYQVRSYGTLAFAIHLQMKAFRHLDLAKIAEIHEQGLPLPDIDQLPKLA